jgi:hypothetical protein
MDILEIKTLRVLLLTIILFICCVALLGAQSATIREITGKVEIQGPGQNWKTAVQGTNVSKGTTISTGFNSTAVLDLDSSVVQVKALTRMTLEELIRREGTVKTDLSLKVGRIRANVQTAEGVRHDFSVISPTSTAAVRGTVIEGDGEEWLTESGSMTVTTNSGSSVTVTAGQEILITGIGAPPAPRDAFEENASVSISTNPTEGGSGGFSLPDGLGPFIDMSIGSITIEVIFEE